MSIFICCLLAWILSGVIANVMIFVNYKNKLNIKDYYDMLIYSFGGLLWLYVVVNIQYELQIKKLKHKIKEYVFGKIQK